MQTVRADHDPWSAFRLEFRPLHQQGRGYAFPCDAGGRVDIDALGERARNDYFYARAAVGRELTRPKVRSCTGS